MCYDYYAADVDNDYNLLYYIIRYRGEMVRREDSYILTNALASFHRRRGRRSRRRHRQQ